MTPEPSQVTRTVREHLAGYNYQAAWLLAKQARELEASELEGTEADDGNDLQRLRSLAIGAVLAAAAALEAKVNDLFITCRDEAPSSQPGRDERTQRAVAAVWDEAERLSILRKLQLFLALANLSPLDEGSRTFQAASDLIALRNRLTHYKAEWQSDSTEDAKLERRLAGKFAPNRHAEATEPFIPYRCLGAGAATWAVETLDALDAELGDRIEWAAGYTLRRVRQRRTG